MNHTQIASVQAGSKNGAERRAASVLLALMMAAGLVACGDKGAAKSGQALVNVNGEEITALQVNEELQRTNVPAGQQQAVQKQVIESLIDRQLLLNEAEKEKVDRDLKVVQSIERAKALIVAQAYMQKKLANLPKPTKAEVQAYYDKHPEFFAQRKQFDLRQLVIRGAVGEDLKKYIDSAKTLDEVAAWMDSHNIVYARNQLSRSTSDLPPALSSKLLSMSKGQLFLVREGDANTLMVIAEIRDAGVDVATAENQIIQYLANTRAKEAGQAELKRLREAAKIQYLNKADGAPAPAAAPATAADAPVAPAADGNAVADPSVQRGVAGLK
ncbi:MAG: EpsD family peptidyl-prolyl cis-trans isomerase [Duganella sp.]